ncbi:hypothetical protein BDZ89DRAFT_1055913 [Hymenopellis radicata]|nr:hypothetical protein BDZ89DRAFT_1055913 [Hymenopellis radicata]
MRHQALTLVTLLSGLLAVASAQKNITVNETDSAITYIAAGDASICKYDSNGNVVGGQAGCYNVLPTGCTDSVAMSQQKTASASFKFNGSAIYINSLMYTVSPLYTVTLDGKETEVDGYADVMLFSCEKPLFSRTGLDPTVEHEITLATKGVSPSAAATQTGAVFSLISFVYTQDNSTNSSTSSASATTSAEPSTESDNGVPDLLVHNLQAILGLFFMLGFAEMLDVVVL